MYYFISKAYTHTIPCKYASMENINSFYFLGVIQCDVYYFGRWGEGGDG
jgi:hypothetical protein